MIFCISIAYLITRGVWTGRLNRESFQKKVNPPKKWIGYLLGNWKKSGPQSRNHASKISRFWVTGQKPKSKKGPKSQITRQNIFLGSSRWYQKMRRKILHHPCEFQKNPLVCSRMLRVTELGRVFQYVPV